MLYEREHRNSRPNHWCLSLNELLLPINQQLWLLSKYHDAIYDVKLTVPVYG